MVRLALAVGVVVIPVMMTTAGASDRPATGRGEGEPPVELAGGCRGGIGISFPPLAWPHCFIRTIEAALGTARAGGSDLVALFLLRGHQRKFFSRRLLTHGQHGQKRVVLVPETWRSDEPFLYCEWSADVASESMGTASLTRGRRLTRMYNLEKRMAISRSAQIMHSGEV